MKIIKSGEKVHQQGVVVWLSGLPCSGKTTICLGLEKKLASEGYIVRMLDGDVTRKGICSDLGFSAADRTENIRRVAEIARLFAETGVITLCAFITPTEELRDLAKRISHDVPFLQVFVDAPLDICENRDVKGMYKKARRGEIQEFTGVSAPFEIPGNADIVLKTSEYNPDQNITELYEYLLPIIEQHEK